MFYLFIIIIIIIEQIFRQSKLFQRRSQVKGMKEASDKVLWQIWRLFCCRSHRWNLIQPCEPWAIRPDQTC